MANEPERPIEKLLRAAAKKRRDEAGAPLELHPATRRLLQGEVARTFAKPGRGPRSFSEALGQLWPRFAWGVAIFAVLVVAGYALLPVPGKGKSEALLARNEPMSRAVPAKQALPPPPTAPAPALAPPAPAVESQSSTVASAKTAPPAPASPARQLRTERQALAKDSLVASADRETREQPAPSAAPQRAEPAESRRCANRGLRRHRRPSSWRNHQWRLPTATRIGGQTSPACQHANRSGFAAPCDHGTRSNQCRGGGRINEAAGCQSRRTLLRLQSDAFSRVGQPPPTFSRHDGWPPPIHRRGQEEAEDIGAVPTVHPSGAGGQGEKQPVQQSHARARRPGLVSSRNRRARVADCRWRRLGV